MTHRTPASLRLLAPIVLFAVALTGCKKDDQANKTLDLLDETTEQIVAKVKTAESPKQGVADAQAYLDEHKDDLHTKMVALGELRGFELSDDTTARMEKSLTDNVVKVQSLQLDLMSATISDKSLDADLTKLTDSYTNAIMP